MAVAGAIIGSRKDLNERDLLQAGVGITIAGIVFSYLSVFLGLISVANLLGASIAVMLPGVFGLIIAPIIAAILGLVLYLVVAFITAIFVKMK
jgi:tetrahydromethanopterin S-methyltransferase subunit C